MIHIFTSGTVEQVNALYTQCKKRLTYPYTIHCLTNQTVGYLKQIDLIDPARQLEFAWAESLYLELVNVGDFILVMPANVFITPRFQSIVEIPKDCIRFDSVHGFAMWNEKKFSEKEYIAFGTFEEYLKSLVAENKVLPMDGFFTLMPVWWERSKDHEALLYDTELGLYNPILPDKAHIELTDECAVKCPMCIQTSHSDPTKPSIFVRRKQLTLQNIQAMFTPEFMLESKLQHVELCGNVGEPTQAKDFLEICRYFVDFGVVLSIHTNGMKVAPDWWKSLAAILKPTYSGVFFGLDGASAEVHQKIRPFSNFKQILANAKEFIDAGGTAFWKFVIFDQPREHRFLAEKMSKDLGFKQFMCVGEYPAEKPPLPQSLAAKIEAPVSDDRPTPRTQVVVETKQLAAPVVKLETIQTRRAANAYIERRITTGSAVRCQAKVGNRFYMDAGGNVFPCSYTAMEILKAALSPHHDTPFPYNWDMNNAKKHSLKNILTNEFFTRYMSYSLKLDPSTLCRRQCGI